MIEQERNVINGSVAVALSGFFEYFEPFKWFAICGIILVICDLRFGILAAKKRGEKIRKSRAMRRTMNKIVDYICWILLAIAIEHTFGISLHIPLIPVFVMLIIYGIEINSVFSNYFEYRNIPYKFNFLKWIFRKADDVDIELENKNNEVDNKNNE